MQDTAYVPKPKTGYSPNACPIPLPQFGCNSFHSPTAATARSRSSGSGIPVASRSLLLNEFQDLHLLQKLRQAPRTGSPPHGEQKVTVPEAPGHGLRTCGRKHPVDERSPEVKAASYIFRSRASCMRRSHAEQIGVCLQRSDGHPSKYMKYFFQSMLGAMLLLSGVFAFSSCGNDESDPDSTVTIAMATVEKQPQYDAPYLVLDNGEKLWVVQHIVPYRDLKAGERIFGNYSFLEAGESGFAYNIRLNDYTLVPVQEIIGLNPDNMDSIGNMKVQIKDMWPSDDYLNVRFMLNFPSPQKPILNLVVNEMIPWTKDGYAHLELRYNNNGSQGRLVPGMVSFKLGDYSPENSELKGIKVLVNPVDGEEKTYIFSYPLTGEDVPGFNPLDLAELK